MSREMSNFQFDETPIRVTIVDGTEWFNANDVCGALGFENGPQAVAMHVDGEDISKRYTLTAGGKQQANFINESGLYCLIFGSKLEAAKRFKKWVTSEGHAAKRSSAVMIRMGVSADVAASILFATVTANTESNPMDEGSDEPTFAFWCRKHD